MRSQRITESAAAALLLIVGPIPRRDSPCPLWQALSAGTFLYVAIMEIFAHELHQPRDVFLKLVLGFVGFAVMGAIKVLLDAD
jgi:hypothetical protein